MGAFKQMPGFRGEASVKTWLTRIAMRQAARHHRSEYRRKTPVLHLPEPGAREADPAGAEGGGETVGREMDVRRAVEMLSPEHREVVVLREFEGMSYGEMADALGVPQGTVESRLFRARKELKELLRDYLT